MIIRKAIPDDAEFIAKHLLLAMEDIVYMFIGSKDKAKATEFMLHFVQQANNQYSYQNCWVAVIDTEVVAAVNLYDGARLDELRRPVIEHIRSEFNQDFRAEDETQAGEYYIDSIGVHTLHRAKGVGSKLLQFLIDEYANKQRKTLGLLVEEGNPNARRLYLKMGFKIVGQKSLFGKSMEHLQFTCHTNSTNSR